MRFDLRLPLELLREGTAPVRLRGETRNLSTAGVLFTSEAAPAIGQPVEYAITLPKGSPDGASVRLHCMGKIVRAQHSPGIPDRVATAATLERYEFVHS